MPFEIIRNDITHMRVDAIVNTANPRPVIGSGTDAAIHAAAGPDLIRRRKEIGFIDTGKAVITPGFSLPAKYVIHTVGPVWYDGGHGEAWLLRQCYDNSLLLAAQHRLESIAFPMISTGNYGFPKALALQVATEAITQFLMTHDMLVYLVVFSKKAFDLSGKLMANVRSFIDEHYVEEKESVEYSFCVRSDYSQIQGLFNREDRADSGRYSAERNWNEYMGSPVEVPQKSLEGMLKEMDRGFSDTLLSYIDRTGKKDSEIYKKANISRQHFSKIRNNPHYMPSKTTALAFAVALELDLSQTRDFIGRAGYALTRSSRFDVIVEYFITQKKYNIHEINMVLFEYDQSLLGS